MNQLTAGLLFALTLATSSSSPAQNISAVTHALLIDGRGGPPVPNTTVVMRGDVITSVGPTATTAIPSGARVIDAHGRAILPGLADMHVHLASAWDGEHSDILGFERGLDAALYAGVTTLFDFGNVSPLIEQMRQETAAGRLVGPRIYMVGPLIDGADAAWPELSYPVSSVAQIPSYISRLSKVHVDLVKAYVGLSDPQLRALVSAAAKDSLRVVADLGIRNGGADGLRAGIAEYAHLGILPTSDEAVELFRTRKAFSVTTLAVYESWSGRRPRDPTFLDTPLLASVLGAESVAEYKADIAKPGVLADSARAVRMSEYMKVAMANAKRLNDAGVLLVAGTDAPYLGDYYGEGLHRELELLVEAGLTPLQAISTATSNAARMVHDSGWGTIEAGKRADLIIVDGNPALRISDTRRIVHVIQLGRIVDRNALTFDGRHDPGYRPTGSPQNAH